MIAYHGDPAIKEKYLARVRAHREADELVRGTGWDGHRGCAVGCTLEKYEHARYETELGIPAQIAHLEDCIFENLPTGHLDWPERFLSAIPVGADLSLVWPRFALWLLTDSELLTITNENRESIDGVTRLYRRIIAREIVAKEEWAMAAYAAAVEEARAAAAAARVAAYAEPRWAADATAAATRVATDAARAEREERAEARASAWQLMADKLIELLETP